MKKTEQKGRRAEGQRGEKGQILLAMALVIVLVALAMVLILMVCQAGGIKMC